MAEPHPETHPDVLSEIATKGDFPAAARVIQRLNDSVRRDDCKTIVVARTILQDPGLSSKVLRLVNSVLYRHGGEPVATISRAVILLGFDAIRDLTGGILLMDQLLPRGKGEWMRGACARSFRCGLVAQAVSARVGYSNPEEAYLLGLFANLGTLWLAAYYPERFAAVRAATEDERRVAAIERAFGVRPADLAARILEHWGFPPHYAAYFRRPPAPDGPVHDQDGKLAATVSLAVDYTGGDVPVEAVLARFEKLFGLPPEQFTAAACVAEQAFREQAPALGFPLPKPARSERAVDVAGRAGRDVPDGIRATADVPSTLAVVGEITGAILANENINDILSMLLEGLARTAHYDSVLLALLDPSQDRVVGRLGFGEGVEEFLRTMVVPLDPGAGVLADAILARQPRVVPNGSPGDLVPRGVSTGMLRVASFIVVPLVVRRKAVGALLAARAGSPPVGDADLAVVQLFSNQASLALDRAAG